MNSYEQKQEARRERYLELADKNRARSTQEFRKADLREEVSGIPFGQPILIGHHSEGRHRRAIERADNAMRRSIEADKTASYYEDKADGVGRAGISSDDPEAATKLQAKIDKAIARQEHMKASNKALRKGDDDALRALGYSDEGIAAFKAPDFCGRTGFASYELTNNNANIRRMKLRIDQLRRDATRETKETEGDGYRLVENADENRIQLFFPGKPSAEIRTMLKSRGFRWSRYNGCWQRHLNSAGRYAAQGVIERL